MFEAATTRQFSLWDGAREPRTPNENRPPVKAVLAFSPDAKTLLFCGPHGIDAWVWPGKASLDQSPLRAWTAPTVYNVGVVNVGVVNEERVVCAAKRGALRP